MIKTARLLDVFDGIIISQKKEKYADLIDNLCYFALDRCDIQSYTYLFIFYCIEISE